MGTAFQVKKSVDFDKASSALLANHLHHYSPQVVRQNNLLLSRGVIAVTEASGCFAHWRFEYSHFQYDLAENKPSGNNEVSDQAPCWIQLSHDHFSLRICFLNDHWQQQVRSRHWQDYSNNDQPLSFTLSHDSFLQHLHILFGVPWLADTVNHELLLSRQTESEVPSAGMQKDMLAKEDHKLRAWRWKAECDGHTAEGLFLINSHLLSQLASQPVWQRVKLPTPPALRTLSTGMAVHIDVPPVSSTDLSAFALGDVLIGSGCADNKVTGFLRPEHSDRPFWTCQINLLNGQCRLHKPWLPDSIVEDSPLSQPNPEQSAEHNVRDDNQVLPISAQANDIGDTTVKMDKNSAQSKPSAFSEKQYSKDQHSQDEPVNESSDSLAGSLQSLPVKLSFQLAETELSLGELEQLQGGHIFNLNTPIEGTSIKVIANSKVIARGELVLIGEYFGVRLTELV